MASLAAPKRLAKVVAPTSAGVEECGRVLASGGLCAFPTETVYGLGANALDEAAVRRIFEVKRRPLSDPLIVHVAEPEDALGLVDLGGARAAAHKVFVTLTRAFWPGPLTLVCPARNHLPACLGAGTGTVGVRCPSHGLARALIGAAGVPVAAPSANLFGHVSPTRAQHVVDDLGASELHVLDGSSAGEFGGDPPCAHGIESTVCAIAPAPGRDDAVVLTVYRRGAVAATALERAIADETDAELRRRGSSSSTPTPTTRTRRTRRRPPRRRRSRIPAALVSLVAEAGADDAKSDAYVAQCVVVDFGGRLAALEDVALAYRDLSAAGDAAAPPPLFETLRWAEDVPKAKNVFIADLQAEKASPGLIAGVADRVYRATSGNTIEIPRAPKAEGPQ
ncbi:L-threonylcarbamoyladenylate synthase [Aureococcus anophagefferens]|nr:L-threonylcarbamoyladenylate synthase [Aureococcus anophagefferens]